MLLASISLAWWLGDAALNRSEWCPDGYCTYLSKIHWALTGTGPVATAQLREFVREYTHAHSPLAPLVGGVLLIWLPGPEVSFVVVSLVATLLAWGAMVRSPSIRKMPPSTQVMLQAAFFSNAIVVRSFARPTTDATGLACTIGALVAMERFVARRGAGRAAILSLCLTVGTFARVSFLPVLAVPPIVELLLARGSFAMRLGRVLSAFGLFTVAPVAISVAVGGTPHQ